MFSWVGLVHDLRKPPQKIYDEARQNKQGIHLPELPSLPEIQEGISEGIEELAAAIKPRKPASERT